jgi:polyisoprenoid-binding protein YceI
MKKINILFTILLFGNICIAQSFTPVDAESKVRFVIKNFGIKVGGDFTGLKGNVVFNPKDLANSKFNISVSASSINSSNNTRDKHLRKSEYFDVEKYSTINFVSTKIVESTNADRFYVYGNLTIKGVTKAIQFGFGAVGNADAYNFTGTFDVNRRDFSVGSSSISLSDNLTVTLNITAKK